jgi:ribonuclease BN (tRNA processing enzyme)
MKFIQHFSGSRGNMYEIISEDGHRLMIDMGVNWKTIQTTLGFDLNYIDAWLVDHLHKDHSKALLNVLAAGIDVYASAETLSDQNALDKRRAYAVSDKTLITMIDGFQVYCFEVEHDCPGCLGFIVREIETDEYLLFATDTAYLRQKFSYKFSIIAIECSYDHAMLHAQVELGAIHETVAKRLLTSHMEWHRTLEYLRDHCDLEKCREIHLLHMSGDRIDKAAVCQEIESQLFIKTMYHGRTD